MSPSITSHSPPQKRKKEKIPTHRKHHDSLALALDDDAQVEADLEAAKGLVDEEVADLGGGDEARGGGEEVGGGEGGGLDAEGAEHEEGFFWSRQEEGGVRYGC